MEEFRPINENTPEGEELLLFNEKWKDEDYNPKGVRLGFLEGSGNWLSARWDNYHDCYITADSSLTDEDEPTHYRRIPTI